MGFRSDGSLSTEEIEIGDTTQKDGKHSKAKQNGHQMILYSNTRIKPLTIHAIIVARNDFIAKSQLEGLAIFQMFTLC
jgi:hypothetical protein